MANILLWAALIVGVIVLWVLAGKFGPSQTDRGRDTTDPLSGRGVI